MKIIEIENLRKTFQPSAFQKRIVAVDDLSFSIDEGKIVGFLGANGAGKTTTIKTLLSLIKPTGGKVRVLGQDPSQPAVRAEVGFLPERPYFYEYLTGIEFLRFYSKLSKKIAPTEKELQALLVRVGLGHAADRQLRRFSKGMLQRVGLAQAICHKPKLLILDEPMSGLDPDGRHEMAQIIRQIRAEGATVFLSSHQLHDIEVLCDEVVMIEKGRLVVQSSVSKLLEQDSKGFEVVYRNSADQTEKLSIENEAELQRQIDKLRAGMNSIIRITPLRPSLEEIFIKYKKST